MTSKNLQDLTLQKLAPLEELKELNKLTWTFLKINGQ